MTNERSQSDGYDARPGKPLHQARPSADESIDPWDVDDLPFLELLEKGPASDDDEDDVPPTVIELPPPTSRKRQDEMETPGEPQAAAAPPPDPLPLPQPQPDPPRAGSVLSDEELDRILSALEPGAGEAAPSLVQAPAPGEVVGGHYRVLSALPSAFGHPAYRVREAQAGTEEVVHVFPVTASTAAVRRRLAREIEAVESLAHHGIAGIREVGDDHDRGLLWVCAEAVEGIPVEEAMRERRGRLPAWEAVDIARQICRALSAAHRRTAHLHLAPGNVVLRDDGAVKILNTGLAASLPRPVLLEGAQAAGTAPYLAPELEDPTREGDGRSDLYSLGVLLYRMLTGHLPQAPVLPPSHAAVGVPMALDDIVLRCLQIRPEDRPAKAKAVDRALAAALNRSPRISLLWPLAAASVLMLAGAAVVLGTQRVQSETSRPATTRHAALPMPAIGREVADVTPVPAVPETPMETATRSDSPLPAEPDRVEAPAAAVEEEVTPSAPGPIPAATVPEVPATPLPEPNRAESGPEVSAAERAAPPSFERAEFPPLPPPSPRPQREAPPAPAAPEPAIRVGAPDRVGDPPRLEDPEEPTVSAILAGRGALERRPRVEPSGIETPLDLAPPAPSPGEDGIATPLERVPSLPEAPASARPLDARRSAALQARAAAEAADAATHAGDSFAQGIAALGEAEAWSGSGWMGEALEYYAQAERHFAQAAQEAQRVAGSVVPQDPVPVLPPTPTAVAERTTPAHSLEVQRVIPGHGQAPDRVEIAFRLLGGGQRVQVYGVGDEVADGWRIESVDPTTSTVGMRRGNRTATLAPSEAPRTPPSPHTRVVTLGEGVRPR